jgi:hypothetical protein
MENQSVRFGFKSKQKMDANNKPVKDEKGQVVMIPAPNPVVVDLPLFVLDVVGQDEAGKPIYGASSADIASLLESGDVKQIQTLLDAANEVIINHAKLQLDDALRENKDVWPKIEKQTVKIDGKDQEVEVEVEPADLSWLDFKKLDWSYIAALPPKQKGARGIPEETWNAFAEDYKTVVMEHGGKTEEQAEAASKHFLNKFAIVRSNKKLLQALDRNLTLWAANTKKADELAEVQQNLQKKLNELLAADEDVLIASV